jgi:hypothetical protein
MLTNRCGFSITRSVLSRLWIFIWVVFMMTIAVITTEAALFRAVLGTLITINLAALVVGGAGFHVADWSLVAGNRAGTRLTSPRYTE